MKITNKDLTDIPASNSTGEKVYALIGNTEELGGTKQHSLGHVVITPKGHSKLHYHPVAEETYYILSGKGKIAIEDNVYSLSKGEVALIMPNEKHQIFCDGEEDLEFLVVCAPAWEINNSILVNE
jgi:mannose-6-phosphate isomerase-like protein (cupin superfamily)